MLVQPPVVGGTYDWLLKASLNSEVAPEVYGAWNITGATVTISFVPPTGVGQHFTATILSAPGQAHYVNATSLFNVAGEWGVSWKVSLGGTVLESQIVYFQVYPSGAAT